MKARNSVVAIHENILILAADPAHFVCRQMAGITSHQNTVIGHPRMNHPSKDEHGRVLNPYEKPWALLFLPPLSARFSSRDHCGALQWYLASCPYYPYTWYVNYHNYCLLILTGLSSISIDYREDQVAGSKALLTSFFQTGPGYVFTTFFNYDT